MSRLAVTALVTAPLLVGLAVGCSKSKPATQEKAPADDLGGGGQIAVPGSKTAPAPTGATGAEGAPAGETAAKADDKRFRLQPEEGQLAIEAPAGAKAGAEAIAKIVMTPGAEFKFNTEFPTKLTLDAAEGVTIAKPELKAGGADKAKGDADKFEESGAVFAVKLTPGASGTHTVNGTFKFAVCDKSGTTCLVKKEPIAIQVAAQ